MHATDRSTPAFLIGGGEMGERIRAFDWARTPLGPVASWSPSLRMMTNFLLANRFPLLLWWGPQFIQIYNDPYRPVLGTKHPSPGLGRPGSECWSEIWHILQPLIETPFHGGPATWMDDIFLEVNRFGFVEETHFTIAYSPVPDETVPSGIGGVLATVNEITEKVVGERRLGLLRDLGAHASEAKSAEEACAIAATTLANAKDVPFALFYLIDPDRKQAHLAAASGIAIGTDASPMMIDMGSGQDAGPWPLGQVLKSEQLQMVENLGEKLVNVPRGPWSDPPHTAAVIPINSNIPHQPAGFLVAGISPRLRFDSQYRSFVELMSAQIATAVANARAYAEEKKRAEQLAALDQAKTIFFSNVSHELRTPLTLMLGPLEESLSLQHGALPAEVTNNLSVAHRNSLRLLKLVNTLLDFARIEANRIEANYEPTDLSALTTDLASVFRSAIERAGLRLVLECPPLPEPVFVDREMWEKIVLNLLSNAFKFTFEGEIKVALNWCGERVELMVSDTGVGIPEEDLPKVFDRFHRVRGTKSRTHEGTGIGLALVQQLAHLHGGEVKVRSREGSGSAFIVSIQTGRTHLPPDHVRSPRHPTPAESKAAFFSEEALRWLPDEPKGPELSAELLARGPSQPKVPSARILLADDNSDMRDYVRRLLLKQFEVETVPDGEAALKSIRAHRPDLVLADVMMPCLDGFGLLQKIRSDEQTRTIPFILLSARAGEESRLEGLDAGADDYLIKPFSARELVARVQSQLELARLRREGQERVRQILDSITDGFYVVDAEGRFVELNAAAREMFSKQGVDVQNIVGRHVFDVFPEGRHEAIGRALSKSLADRRPADVEEFFTPWKRWYHLRFRPLPEGGMATFFQDITERKQAEIAVRESEEHLELVSNTVPTLISYIGKDFRYRSCNRAYTEWFGVPREDIVGQTVREVVGEKTWLSLEPRLKAAVEGRAVEFETEIKNHGGETRWIHVVYTPHHDLDGNVLGIVVLATDITQRKHDFEGLARLHGVASRFVNEGNFQSLMEEIVDSAIALTHADKGNIQLYNSAAGTLEIAAATGFSASWLAYFNHLEPAKAGACGRALRKRQRVIVEDVTTSEIFAGTPALGVQLADDIRAVQSTPLVGRAGDLLGVVSTHFHSPHRPTERELHWLDLLARQAADLIERSRSEQALRRAQAELREHAVKLERAVADRTAQLQETVSELESFSYSIAHDMRAPLRSMRGFAGILNLDHSDKLDVDTKDFLRRISASAERLDRLIEDVLNYSKVVRGQIPVEPVKTENLVREIIESYPDFQPPRATVLVQSPLFNVRANPAALTQIISNLLSNAVKFVAPGTSPRVVVRSERSGDAVRLWFEDNGIGIPPEGVERIFKMFQRLHPVGVYEGTGIGLTIIRKAADRMGGRVGVESEPGKGSRFWVELPKA